jgi:hypothetical protein
VARSLQDLYYADVRLRLCIINHLEFIARRSLELAIQHILLAKVALQLALYCQLRFGDAKDIEFAVRLMVKNSLTLEDLRNHVGSISQSINYPLSKNSLYSTLESQKYIELINFGQYYRKRYLLKRAKDKYNYKIKSIRECFDEVNGLYLRLIYRRTMIIDSVRKLTNTTHREPCTVCS